MKVFLCIFLALNFAAFAVDRPSGFIGIQWGASPEEAKRVLQKRQRIEFPSESDDYHLELTGGTFAGQPVAKWVLTFPERKFAAATVTLKTEGNATAVCKEFRNQLSAKYGPPTAGRTLVASKESKGVSYRAERTASFGSVTTWRFSPDFKQKTSIAIIVELSGPNGKAAGDESQLSVTIKYVNETMAGAVAAPGATGTKPVQAPIKKEDL